MPWWGWALVVAASLTCGVIGFFVAVYWIGRGMYR
jgi:hypothetical protein